MKTQGCSRCRKPFLPGQKVVADPCCGAPDCEDAFAYSHLDCLPPALRALEDA